MTRQQQKRHTMAGNAPRQPHIHLTARELEVLRLAAEGLTNSEIGRVLYVSPHTAEYHMRNALRKLGAKNRTEAVVHAALLLAQGEAHPPPNASGLSDRQPPDPPGRRRPEDRPSRVWRLLLPIGVATAALLAVLGALGVTHGGGPFPPTVWLDAGGSEDMGPAIRTAASYDLSPCAGEILLLPGPTESSPRRTPCP